MRRVSKLNKDYMYFYTKVSSANVTPAGRMVYRALLRYANRKTWSCFPSVKTIVNDTGLSERTVRKQIKILVEEELIIKIGIHRCLNQMVQMVLNRIQEVINEQRYRNKIFE